MANMNQIHYTSEWVCGTSFLINAPSQGILMNMLNLDWHNAKISVHPVKIIYSINNFKHWLYFDTN